MRLSPDASKLLDHLYRHPAPDLSSPDEVWTTPFGQLHRECFFRHGRDPRVSVRATLRRWTAALDDLKVHGFVIGARARKTGWKQTVQYRLNPERLRGLRRVASPELDHPLFAWDPGVVEGITLEQAKARVGWHGILARLYQAFPLGCRIIRVGRRNGRLHLEASGDDPGLLVAMRLAERASTFCCEGCGNIAGRRHKRSGKILVLCNGCLAYRDRQTRSKGPRAR